MCHIYMHELIGEYLNLEFVTYPNLLISVAVVLGDDT